MDQEPKLAQVLDVFLHLCAKGKEWIFRNDIHEFDCSVSYHAVVETIQTENEATLVIGRRSDGTPLMWNEDWNQENNQFCRVLLRVERLHPEQSLLPYGTTTRLYDLLNEGELLEVKICFNDSVSSPNLFRYHAISGCKIRDSVKRSAENIRNPLRGCVEKIYENEQVGLINFGTYDGRVAKAVFFSSELYVRGEKYCGSLNSIAPIGAELFLEVTSWNSEGITESWASALRKIGTEFIATRVWLKSDQRPSQSVGGSSSNDVTKTNGVENDANRNEDLSKSNFSSIPKNPTQSPAYTSGNRTHDATKANGKENSGSRNEDLSKSNFSSIPKNPTQNPACSTGNRTHDVTKANGKENSGSKNEDPAKSKSSSFPKNSTENRTVFKGVLECFIDLHRALVCIAHRSFTPLGFNDDWCDKSVCLERVVLNCCDLKPSESHAPFSKDTVISNVVNIGDYLELTLEPYEKSPKQCYKWHAKTCCKIQAPKLKLNTVSVHSLASDYLYGIIESVMEHEGGIINFITYTGFPAKAYFKREHIINFNGSLCGGYLSNGFIGTEVKLIVRTRLHENNEKDQNMLKGGVLFTAIKVWLTGNQKILGKSMNESDLINESFSPSSSKEVLRNAMNEEEINKNIITETEKQGTEPVQPCNVLGSNDESEHSNLSNHFNVTGSISGTCSIETDATVGPETKISPEISSELSGSNNNATSDFCSDVKGMLISLDVDWGMVAVDGEVLPFDTSSTYLFGLLLQGIPLYKIFHYEQQVKVSIRSEEVLRLDYGLPQPFNEMRNSVLIYCERKQLTAEVKEILVQSIERQRMCSLASVNEKSG